MTVNISLVTQIPGLYVLDYAGVEWTKRLGCLGLYKGHILKHIFLERFPNAVRKNTESILEYHEDVLKENTMYEDIPLRN